MIMNTQLRSSDCLKTQAAASRSLVATLHFDCSPVASLLEDLPAEIRRLVILSLANLEDLANLIRASPRYHAQYLVDRETFLRHSLVQTLGTNTLVDAFSCRESRIRLILQSRSLQRIGQFFSEYALWKAVPSDVIPRINLAELTRIASFYLSVVRPLVYYFFGTFFANLKSLQVNTVQHGPPRKISATERSRILRALYRFQLYCHAFGYIKRPINGEAPGQVDFDRAELVRKISCIFEPWEIEEISCIDALTEAKYATLFSELGWTFKGDKPNLAKYGGDFEIGPEHISTLGALCM